MTGTFVVGDIVDVKNRKDLTAYGEINEINGRNAIVHFKLPRRSPKRSSWDSCESCGWPGFLSINGETGELVCMRSGCGHSYGFEERDKIIPLEKLINISAERAHGKKDEALVEFKVALGKALEAGIITRGKKAEVLQMTWRADSPTKTEEGDVP